MTLLQKLKSDLEGALRAREGGMVQALRLVLTEIHNREIQTSGAQKTNLREEEVVNVLRREVKKRKEAILLFKQGGREDLVQREEAEIAFLEVYLPKALETGEIQEIVEAVIREGKKDFGGVMKEVMTRLGGRADGRLVAGLVKKSLGS